MISYKQRNKDKAIRIFSRIDEQLPDGRTVKKKVYLHDEDADIRAYVRSLSVNERGSSNEVQADNRIEVTVNYRRSLERRQDSYIEFDGRTYAIVGVDPLEFKGTEMKLTCRSVTPPRFDSIEYVGKECDCPCGR